MFWTLCCRACLSCTGDHDTEVFELPSSTPRNSLAVTAESCTKCNYTILKAARAFSHFQGDVLEELNQREAAFKKYKSFCFVKEVHVHTTSLYPIPMDDLVLLPGDSQRHNPGCIKNYGNVVVEIWNKWDQWVVLSLPQSNSPLSSLLTYKFNLNSTDCSLTINIECHPTEFS